MRRKYTKELLEPIVASSISIAEVLRKLGLDHKAGGNYRYINATIRAMGLSTSHFLGAAWARGRRIGPAPRVPDEAIFVENCAHAISGARVKQRLLRQGRAYVCESCGISEWQGQPLTLHLDHINGINNDNRLENLRLLCPNCHQQTATWGNKKASG